MRERSKLGDRPRDSRLWSIVLAAGGSSRLGRPKQLLRLRAKTLLSRAVGLADGLTPGRVVVVIGAERLRLRRQLHIGCPSATVATNPRWQHGISSSLARGIRALPTRAAAALVLLSDQPHVTAADLRRLVGAWRRHKSLPAAAAYAGRVGVPAIIPARHFGRLRRGSGDTGARTLLRDSARIARINMPAAAFDIDTPADARRLREPGR